MKSKSHNPIDVHIGGRVRMRRVLLGLSQENLGDQLGITFQQIQKYERGVNRIGAGRLLQIAEILRVRINYFYEGAPRVSADDPDSEGAVYSSGFGEAHTPDISVDFLSSSEGVELIKAFTSVTDPKVRKQILNLVRSLSKDS